MSLGEKYRVMPPTSINNFKSNFMLPIAHSNTTNHTYLDLSSQEGSSKKNYISKNLELPSIVTQKSTNNQIDSPYSPYQVSSPKNQGGEYKYTLESYK